LLHLMTPDAFDGYEPSTAVDEALIRLVGKALVKQVRHTPANLAASRGLRAKGSGKSESGIGAPPKDHTRKVTARMRVLCS
jgi:hypothetical protein